MHRLETFLTEILQPKLSELASESVRGSAERLALIRGEIIEAFLWLHMGREVGAFPEGASRALYTLYFLPFFESLLSNDLELREAMRKGILDVAHSDESRMIKVELPRYAGILMEDAMRGKDIFETEPLKLGQPTAVSGFCQVLLLLHSSVATSPAVRQFTYAITFAREPEWYQDWKTVITPNEVIEAEFTGIGSPIALALGGYLAFWGYAARCQEAFENIEGREGVRSDDLFRLRTRLQEILRWRINLRRAYAANRYELIYSKVSKAIEEESNQPGVNSAAAKVIQSSIESAFTFLDVPLPVYA